MVNYEFQEYEQVNDRRHHFDVYEDGVLTEEYILEEDVWWKKDSEKEAYRDTEDIILHAVNGDPDEYDIEEKNAYGVKYTYYCLQK